DTPGVLSVSDDKASSKLMITASRTDSKNPDLVAYELLKSHRASLMEYYGVEDQGEDEEELLELIARKLNRFRSGGVPDTETTAKMILQDWQKGKILL
ncbi:MAG: hypothetical protein KDK61_09120, partial [Simkania sp.]|nr:hypothetical protein [Simkania sp.]